MGVRRYRPRACQSLSCSWNTVAKSRGSPPTDKDTPYLMGTKEDPYPLDPWENLMLGAAVA